MTSRVDRNLGLLGHAPWRPPRIPVNHRVQVDEVEMAPGRRRVVLEKLLLTF